MPSQFWDDMGGLALQGAGGVIGAGMGLALGGIERKNQFKQQQKMQKLQIQGQMEMTDYNYQKQMQMWKDTSYAAQVEQMKKAGINPALMYGMGGGGGQTASLAQGSVSGGQAAPSYGAGQSAMSGMGLALMAAQTRNIEAQTKKTEAEIPNVGKEGVKLDTEVQSLLQGINNAKAQQALTEVQTGIASIEEQIKGKTQNAAQALVMTELRKATAEMDILERNNDIDAKTKEDKINIVKAQLGGMLIGNAAAEQGITASKAQVQQAWAEIAQGWQGLAQGKQALSQEQQKINIQAAM